MIAWGLACPTPTLVTCPLRSRKMNLLAIFAVVVRHFALAQFVVFGHSVGGAMAAGVAANYPGSCTGLVTESAQFFVESVTLDGIRSARQQFAQPGQVERLGKYHGDKAPWVLSAWVDSWLSDSFSLSFLDEQLRRVACPVLSLHEDHDAYGSLRHPEYIASRAVGPVTRRVLSPCGHVPHREQPEEVLSELQKFLAVG